MLLQSGRKRNRGDEISRRSGETGDQLGESGSLHDSQDSLSLAASHVQRALEPELDRASILSEDGASESIDGRPRAGRAGSGGLPTSQSAVDSAGTTGSLLGRDGQAGSRIRLTLSFDGTRPAQLDASAAGGGTASTGLQSTAQHDGSMSGAAVSAGDQGHPGGAGKADGPISTSGKPADTARRKALGDEGVGLQQRGTTSAVDGVVLEGELGRGHAHLDGTSLPDGADARSALQGKKRATGTLVEVHASAEGQSSAGRKATAPGKEGTGGAFRCCRSLRIWRRSSSHFSGFRDCEANTHTSPAHLCHTAPALTRLAVAEFVPPATVELPEGEEGQRPAVKRRPPPKAPPPPPAPPPKAKAPPPPAPAPPGKPKQAPPPPPKGAPPPPVLAKVGQVSDNQTECLASQQMSPTQSCDMRTYLLQCAHALASAIALHASWLTVKIQNSATGSFIDS